MYIYVVFYRSCEALCDTVLPQGKREWVLVCRQELCTCTYLPVAKHKSLTILRPDGGPVGLPICSEECICYSHGLWSINPLSFREWMVRFGFVYSTRRVIVPDFVVLVLVVQKRTPHSRMPRQFFNHYSTGLPWVQSWENFLSLKLWNFHIAFSQLCCHPSWPFVA